MPLIRGKANQNSVAIGGLSQLNWRQLRYTLSIFQGYFSLEGYHSFEFITFQIQKPSNHVTVIAETS